MTNREHRPVYIDHPIEDLGRLYAEGYTLIQEKLDGHYLEKAVDGITYLCEHMIGTQRALDDERYGQVVVWDVVMDDTAEQRLLWAMSYCDNVVPPLTLDEAHRLWDAGRIEGLVLRRPSDMPDDHVIRIKRSLTVDLRVSDVVWTGKRTVIHLRDCDGANCGSCMVPQIAGVRAGDLVEVKAMEWTRAGLLRHPRFLRIRTDKTHADRRPS